MINKDWLTKTKRLMAHEQPLAASHRENSAVFGLFMTVFGHFVTGKPFIDLNTNLKPLKIFNGVHFTKIEKCGTREQPLIASHGGILAVMRPFSSFLGHFDQILAKNIHG